MPDLVPAFNAILDKFSKFFDVLDLSYFISGAVAISALVWWIQQSKAAVTFPSGLDAWAVTLLACYVAGLMCFAAGRLLRLSVLHVHDAACRYSVKHLLRRLRAARGSGKEPQESDGADKEQCEHRVGAILRAVSNHHLKDDEVVKQYLGAAGGQPTSGATMRHAWSLYARLWAEARQRPDLKTSLDHLNRSWVISATYDGLAVALTLWVVALYFYMCGTFSARFDAHDLRNPQELVSQIKLHLDKHSAYLYNLLGAPDASDSEKSLKALIDGSDAKSKPTPEMTIGMVYLLNKAITNGDLREKIELVQKSVSPPGESDIVGLNKLELEDAFPGALQTHMKNWTAALLAILALLLIIFGCGKEASRHFQNQVEELFATYAWWRENRPPVAPPCVLAPEEKPK